MTNRRIHVALWASLLILSALWWLSEPTWFQASNYFAFRNVFVQYSGVIAMAAMSVAVWLATRPRWLEPMFRGLDKMYRLHKWLGITALLMSVGHWWFAKGTKWMVGWGWLQRPARGPRPAPGDQGVIEAWFGSVRGLAESVGEWAFYAAAVLMILALLRKVPYRFFAKTHTLLAVLYLALAFHAMVLTRWAYWSQPLGIVQAVLLAVGTVSALKVLSRRVGARRTVDGTVTGVTRYPALDVLEMRIALAPGWAGHQAGQFAFLTTDRAEGAHPYTLASAWDASTREIVFITKALGDHTRQLADELQAGQKVRVEGPYGCFTFQDARPHQVWVGAGVGITPFIARMKELARQTHGAPPVPVDLFHPTTVHDPQAIRKLEEDALAAGIRLHVMVDAVDGRLDARRIRDRVPAWAQASYWFCGPEGLSAALSRDLVRAGVPRAAFHQELFRMR